MNLFCISVWTPMDVLMSPYRGSAMIATVRTVSVNGGCLRGKRDGPLEPAGEGRLPLPWRARGVLSLVTT